MKKVLQWAKPVSILMTTLMLLMSMPCQAVFAGMVGTGALLETERGEQARSDIKRVLARKEIRSTLVDQGVDPAEATARVDSLTDTEAINLAQQIEHLPAGGDTLGVLIVVSLIVFLVLLATDLMGYTNIFPFVS